jgi:hypothetical protein
MKHIDLADITIGGILNERAELSFTRLQEAYFCWPSISKVNIVPFPGDAIGREINGLVLLCMALHHPAPSNLREIMRRLPELQNRDGYLGPVLPDSRANEDVLAAHNGLACGLSEYVMWTQDDQARRMLAHIGDNLFIPASNAIAQYRSDPKTPTPVTWHLSGGDIGQLFLMLDGITRAYRLNPIPGLKSTIETLIARYRGLDLVAISAQTHSMLSAVSGILRWYDVQHREEDLAFAESLYKQYRDQAMTGTFENYNWFNRPEWTEACAVTDSFLVATELWRLTGKSDYLADAHHILYNGLLPGQTSNGGFGTSPCVGAADKAGRMMDRTDAHNEAPYCCSMRGAEGLARAIQYGYLLDDDAIVVPFYAESTATLRFADGICVIRQTTRYPHQGQVRLEVIEAGTATTNRLRLFIPPWAVTGTLSLRVNGVRIRPTILHSFATVDAVRKGDVIELDFQQVSGRQPALHAGKFPNVHCFVCGPLLLGSASADVEPTEALLDIFNPLKPRPHGPGSPVVMFADGPAPAMQGTGQISQPGHRAQEASLYRNDRHAANVPDNTQILFETLKHDKATTVCGLLWQKPQVVTQVILQWPEGHSLPESESIVVRWSVAGTVRESANPGIIGNGRQWIYTLDLQGQSVETDNVIVAFKGEAATVPQHIPEMTIVGR